MIPAREALIRLREGNGRFAEGRSDHPLLANEARRRELMTGQQPFAIIFGCSDSRVPAEIVFDQGLGDLFVVRVAGNVVAPSLLGSVEFAATQFGTRLVVVLGHSSCGAVVATLNELDRRRQAERSAAPGPASGDQASEEQGSPGLRAIIGRIAPALEAWVESDPGTDRRALVERAVRANIRASVEHLRRDSQILRSLIRDEGLLVVGAEYSLETGAVEFLDEPPADGDAGEGPDERSAGVARG